MRAVRFDHYGGPDVLYIANVARPEISDGQLLVKVKACSINPFDYKLREGQMRGGIDVTFPSAQGSDVAGVVEAVGASAQGWAVGDDVLGSTAERGSQAEYAVVNPDEIVRKPSGMSWETAGSVEVVGTTAWAMLAATGVRPGDTVLVSGAAGGVGSLACQLAVAAGATVIGIASAHNHEWLKAHGVTPVAYGAGLEERISVAAGASGVDAVLDAHGDGYIDLGLKLGVAPERIDTIADFAAAAQNPGVKAEGSSAAPPSALQDLVNRLAAGDLELRIDKVFALEQVRAAYELLESGQARGKIVLVP